MLPPGDYVEIFQKLSQKEEHFLTTITFPL